MALLIDVALVSVMTVVILLLFVVLHNYIGRTRR